VFVNLDDIAALGFHGQFVDLVSEWEDGSTRSVPNFRIVFYDQPLGSAAAYCPETNPLVPLTHTADGSNQPAYKSIVIRIVPARDPGAVVASNAGTITRAARADATTRAPEPVQRPAEDPESNRIR
jgi:formate dehydrogenase major subunit